MQYTGFLYAYPLFKTQVSPLTPENLLNVDIINILKRLLKSAENITNAHVTACLEFILKPTSANFCKNGADAFCKDSREYIGDLLNL